MVDNHRVDKKWSNGITTIIAGTGVNGSESDMLTTPWGIFVDINLDLYVADWGNDRKIQLFRLNQRNGITVACSGYGSTNDKLAFPQTMSFDSYGNIYVTDCNNN